MTHEEMEAVIGGYHGDPFRVLGWHAVHDASGAEAWEVRAFLPQAKSVAVLSQAGVTPMEQVDPQGFYVAHFRESPGAYRLRITRWQNVEEEVEDPYRFPPLLTDFQLHLLGEGTHYEVESTLGSHLAECDGVSGVRFAVWAPNAIVVSVVGDFNDWDTRRHPMRLRSSGIWEIFLPGLKAGAVYKYFIKSRLLGYQIMKADPCAFASELPPKSGSVVADLAGYEWGDQDWMDSRGKRDWLKEPMAVYELHLSSWMHAEHHRLLSYRELAEKLVPYVKEMGYTHIELLPPMEHPYGGSWGYQVIGYFAPTARHGSPADFMHFVDRCHQEGIGVIVDWVPAHFPKDDHGLAYFDGTALYEHADPRRGEHRDWGTLIFNYGRNEVRSFLISSALFWLRTYHIDGLRVDAVASMLYLNYSREEGDWLPNKYGGNENLEAIEFLRVFNEQVHRIPGAISIAEESTSFAGVSRPVYAGGLGFTMKWNMGWMHDMLHYFSLDPIHRKFHHNELTFSMLYAFTENFMLPISHDEVVHGKGSLIGRMPGDEWRRFANLRAFLAYMYTHPGKKLLFMGCEIGQYEEWNWLSSVRWDLLQFDFHRKLQLLNKELNWFYRNRPELYEVEFHWSGFEWLDIHDVESSVISFLRWSQNHRSFLLVVCNFTPLPRPQYRIGVPFPGQYREVFNTDASMFGGSNVGNPDVITAEPVKMHNRPASIVVTMPPLAVTIFRRV